MLILITGVKWKYNRCISLGISQNSFDTEMQTIQQFNPIPAPGAYETVQVRTMRPLSNTSQANQDTKLLAD